jgi:ABC-type transport system involved in multi-copper enzyme maturation permease subunit
MMAVEQERVAAKRVERADRPSPLLTVLTWEVRRLASNYINWGIPLAFLGFCLALIYFKHSWGRPVVDGRVGETILIVGTSAIGLPYQIVDGLLVFLGMLLPFVATEAVARDHRAGVHELLMACAVPSWAYVCGRYLAGLIVSLGLALIALVAVLMTSPFLHLTLAGYPAPDFGLIFTIWAVAVLPATILLTSLGFTLGTLWPRLASIIKIVIMIGWVAILFGADVFDHGGTWLTYWSPTGYGIVRVNVDRFLKNYQALVPSVPDVNQHARLALQLQQQLPDLQPWLFPHAVLVVLGIALVALAALRFQRFRNVME